ncbi:MAG TPA: GNAT family N-acetyltransferase [Alphaproteobacteria bacterium]
MSPLPSQAEEILIRPVSDADAAELIELIGAIWRSYPGIVFDVDAELPELRALASAFAHAGGAGWVAERTGRIVGCVGVAPSRSSGDWEILKLYVAADQRRQGLARKLVALAEDWARRHGATGIELWTDTRFTEAHAFYRSLAYAQEGWRRLQDLSRTAEYRFHKRLQPLIPESARPRGGG